MHDILLLADPSPDDNREATAVLAIRAAAVYRTHCLVSHGQMPPGRTALEALTQAAKEVVRGHPGATHILSNVHNHIHNPNNNH